MSFQTGLSGLNAATKNLDVIGNNIANANTTGAKLSRAEFSEVIASTIGAGGAGFAGIGVDVSAVSQQFTQGNITVTGGELDIAINGAGFFPLIAASNKNSAATVSELNQTAADPATATTPTQTNTVKHSIYTRAGMFKLDDKGYIVTNAGNQLFGKNIDYGPVIAGNSTTPTITEGPLRLPTTAPSPAKVTKSITASLNLNARESATTNADVLLGNAISQAALDGVANKSSTAITTYDTQGNPVDATVYLIKSGNNTWTVYAKDMQNMSLPDDPGDPTMAWADKPYQMVGELHFDDNGSATRVSGAQPGAPLFPPPIDPLVTPLEWAEAETPITLKMKAPTSGIQYSVELKLPKEGTTQYATAFGVSSLSQDGYTSGSFTGLKISEGGVITARYSNGQNQDVGQLILVDFRNNQGLKPIGGGNWIPTLVSGEPSPGIPGENKFGSVRAGALEDSNIDLTAELVNMMTAQRAYQANMQTIKTQDQALSALTQLR